MMTLQDGLVAYKTYARAEGKSPKTVAWVSDSVGYFAEFLGPRQQDIASISGHDLRRFIIALQQKQRFSHHRYNKPRPENLSPQSILTYCRGVTAFFGFLHREGFIEANPMEKVKMPKVPETVVPTFSEKEMERLLAQPDKQSNQGFRDYAILLTFIDTAVRLDELANLKAGNIDYEQSYFKVMGKGSKERYVPFGRRVARVLMKYQLKHRPQPVATENFWLRHDGQPLSAARIEKLVSLYGKRAGLKRSYPHKLRHTSAVWYLRNGGGEFSLQRKLGHRSLTMTRRYSNLADSDVRDQHLKYGVADKLKL
jgi:site-specific recombinase XerD